MSNEARTLDELFEHYLELGPGWLTEPPELLAAQIAVICGSKELSEQYIYALWHMTYILQAGEGYLDIHGREKGIYRFDGESDEKYLERIRLIEDQVTVPAILDAINQILEVPEATMVEWLFGGAWSFIESSYGPPPIFSEPKRGFSDTSVAGTTQPGFTIYIPDQFPSSHNRSFPGIIPYTDVNQTGYFAWASGASPISVQYGFAEDLIATPSDIYERVEDIIRRLKAAGVAHRVEVTGTPVEDDVGLFAQSLVTHTNDSPITAPLVWQKLSGFTVDHDLKGLWDGVSSWWDMSADPHPTGAHGIKLNCQIQFENLNKKSGVVAFGFGANGNDPEATAAELWVTSPIDDEKNAASFSVRQMFSYWAEIGNTYDLWVMTDLSIGDVEVHGGLGTWFSIELWKPTD